MGDSIVRPRFGVIGNHRTLSPGECFGEMALLSDRTRNATIRASTAINVLIIPKADFNKLRQSLPAFGDVFKELAKQRAVAGSPHPSVEPNSSPRLIARWNF